ncbi:MAG: ROK family protein [Chloroflexota bacterium]|nr:ROK family protein [Chloroflexota bacterium]
MAERYALGIDYGGTKVLAAVVNVQSGHVLGSSKRKSNASDNPDELMERIFDSGEAAIRDARLGKKFDIIGIGVGIAGQVDAERGALVGTPNLSQATLELPMADLLRDRFGVPAALRNDVQIAAMGEARFGAGRDTPDFLCVFVGTGIGGSLVRDGELVAGAAGSAGEIGHLIVDAGGRLCGCGGRGHLEAYGSRSAMTRALLGELKRGRTSVLTELLPDPRDDPAGTIAIRSGILAKAVAAKDELVIEAVTEAGHYLGLGLASAMNLLNPGLIILGGGVIEALDLLFDVAAHHARRESLPVAAASVKIVKAGLGDNSGVIGAALLGARAAG